MNGIQKLTADEQAELTRCEDEVEMAVETEVKACWQAATALRTIWAHRLYREHGTWEQYVANRWAKTRQWAYDRIKALGVREALQCKPDLHFPAPEFDQALALAPLREPALVAEAWAQVIQEHGSGATRDQVKAVVARFRASPPRLDQAAPSGEDGAPMVEIQSQ